MPFDPGKFEQFKAQRSAPQPRGMMGKAWDALAVPEKMSREGLGMMADWVPEAEPTGNVFRDVALNTPRVLAETVAETAPDFVSRESIVTGGVLKGLKAAKPILKPVGRGLAKAAEQLSGLEHKTPGVLTEAAKDASLIFGRGTGEAGKLFDDLVDKGRIRQSFARSTDAKSLLDEAIQSADDGSLTSEEALIARRTLDQVRKRLPAYAFRKMRETFDAIAKMKSAEADSAFSRAVRSDALRSILPLNKTGGASAFKLGIGTVFPPTAPLMSPAFQGAVASGGGAVARRILKPLTEEAVRYGGAAGPIFRRYPGRENR